LIPRAIMLQFIAGRLVQMVPVLLGVSLIAFFSVHLVPGDPIEIMTLGRATPETIAAMHAEYGLDQPLWRQYLDYLGSLARGNLGPSFKYPNRTVNEIIADKVPVSAELGAEALAIALVLGIGLGVVAAIRRNTWIDYVASSFGMIGISIPTFVVGPLVVLAFAIHLRWFNASGWFFPADRVLPAIVLGIAYAAPISRLTRGGMLEVLHQDFIRTARAKGASELRVVLHHALRGGLLPVVSYLGPAIAGILTGSFVIEMIFQIPGIGREFINSAFNRDYTLVLGTVILYAALIMALNLLVDIAQAWMNPKVRLE
jgi:oligopeptide transport system permease protein